MSGTLVFPVGLPRNWLIQAFHKSAQIREPPPAGFRIIVNPPKFRSAQLTAPLILLIQWRSLVEAAPARQYFIHIPRFHFVRVEFHHQVVVARHHRVSGHLDCKYRRQQPDSLLNPAPPVLVATPSSVVLTAQKGSVNAT